MKSTSGHSEQPLEIGKYRVLSQLGSGAMGQVFRARDNDLDRDVAIKLMNPFSSHSPTQVERFLREVRTVGRLRHRNIVVILDFGMSGYQPFLVMELLEGEDLFRLIESSRGLPPPICAEIAAQVCLGLDTAHRQHIVHRDVKPKNIFLARPGLVKILDFGIARAEESDLTATGQLVGTVDYIAPERILGEKGDHRCDIFSIGVMLHEMLTGEQPFIGSSVTAILRKIVSMESPPLPVSVPPELAAITARAMEKNPGKRYQTAGELADDLKHHSPGKGRKGQWS